MPNPPKYQVKGWAAHFENDRSKTRDRCSFVCVPNKQHGMGFSYVMAKPDGGMIYGIWGLLLGACSQQKRPRQGWLTSDGTEHGEAWTNENLSIKFRRPVAEIARAIEVLSSSEVGWLVAIEGVDNKDVPPNHHAITVSSPASHLEGKGREGKEEKGMEVEISLFTSLRQSLSTAYKRQDADQWSYEEESGLSAISRRPNAKAECEELLKFKLDPDSFFPQSLQSLLSRWGETLDRARNTTAKPLSVTEKGILSKEYDRVLDKLKSLTSQYSGHQDWTVADKLERTKLKERRDELKGKLGIKV